MSQALEETLERMQKQLYPQRKELLLKKGNDLVDSESDSDPSNTKLLKEESENLAVLVSEVEKLGEEILWGMGKLRGSVDNVVKKGRQRRMKEVFDVKQKF